MLTFASFPTLLLTLVKRVTLSSKEAMNKTKCKCYIS